MTDHQKAVAVNIIINSLRENLKDCEVTMNEIEDILDLTKEAYLNLPITY